MLFDAVENASVLDLFAGTGSYGIEALSRGASSALFVDTDVQYVNKNLKGLGYLNGEVIKGDVIKTLSMMSRVFDIIFIDPPYGQFEPDELLKLLKEREILANNGVVVYEESVRTIFKITVEGFGVDTERRYGDTVIRLISGRSEDGL